MLYDSDRNEESSEVSDLTKRELEELMFLVSEQAEFQAKTHMYNDTCWEMCVEKPGAKLDSKTSTCLKNCVDRFYDVTLYISKRYINVLQRNANMM